jgi:hypothetical protein
MRATHNSNVFNVTTGFKKLTTHNNNSKQNIPLLFFIIVFFLVNQIALVLSQVDGDPTVIANCTFTGPATGNVYDLTPLAQNGTNAFWPGQDSGGLKWYINFCRNVAGSPCGGQYTQACQGETSAGKLPFSYTELNSNGTQGVSVALTPGTACKNSARTVTIDVVCNQTANPGGIVSIIELPPAGSCIYDIKFHSIYGCPTGGGGSDVAGWVVVGIIFGGFFLYFVIGMLYQWRVKQASGRELIPNSEFWSSLPGLIVDGFKYTFAKLTCRSIDLK